MQPNSGWKNWRGRLASRCSRWIFALLITFEDSWIRWNQRLLKAKLTCSSVSAYSRKPALRKLNKCAFVGRQCRCDEYPIYHHHRWIRSSMPNGKRGNRLHMLTNYRRLTFRSFLYWWWHYRMLCHLCYWRSLYYLLWIKIMDISYLQQVQPSMPPLTSISVGHVQRIAGVDSNTMHTAKCTLHN